MGFNPGNGFVLKAETVAVVADAMDELLLGVGGGGRGGAGVEGRGGVDGSEGVERERKECLSLIVSHGDCVLKLPPSAVLLGTAV